LSSLANLILSQFKSRTDFPPDIPNVKVCTPPDTPVLHTSIPDPLNPGAYAAGGDDLTLEVELLVVVLLD